MPSVKYDLGYLRAALEILDTYLLSEDLFWPLNSEAPIGETMFPRLTIGGILLSMARLQARPILPYQSSQFQNLVVALDHYRSDMRVAWERKSRREFISRLDQWKHYINELSMNPDENIPFYGSEVRLRLLLDLLEDEITPVDDIYVTSLLQMDKILQAVFIKGGFIWDSVLSPGFNQEKYWYLWGKPSINTLFTP
jgi:hypothetical protein